VELTVLTHIAAAAQPLPVITDHVAASPATRRCSPGWIPADTPLAGRRALRLRDFPDVGLSNREGLPAVPFRSDDRDQ
jgi:hypothetical protein